MIILLLLILFYYHTRVVASCTCSGIEVQLSDQLHCFEIHQNSGSSWSSADQTCASIGGFMGHVTNATLFKTLSAYVDKNYNLPVMTGATVANVELDLVALMCPGNTFYTLLNSTIVSEYFESTPLNSTRCAFITNDNTYKMHFMACDTNSNVLCDRPMETKNYCNIKMNCTETTTTTTTVTTSTVAVKTTALTTLTTTSQNQTSTSKKSTVSNVTTQSTPTKPTASSVATQSTTTAKIGSTATLTSTTSATTTPGKTSDNCGKGYTRIFEWCVPWWCWLIFALLLLLLFLCCFGWLCHFCCTSCLCCHAHSEYAPEKIPESIVLDAICQTDANAIESREIVYVPVPKTPPPERKTASIVVEREKTPPPPQIIHHHHHEVVREPVAPPPPMVYDIKHTENNYTYNNYMIPPIIQQPQIVPSLYYPPQRFDIPMGSAPILLNETPLPLYEDDFAHAAPIPAVSQEVVEPVPMILHDPETIVTLPFPRKNFEEQPEVKRVLPELKHNRPPVSGPVSIVPVVKRINTPEPRAFPAPPPESVNPRNLDERQFPRPPPAELREISVRKNTPLSVAQQPQRLREPQQLRDAIATPPMNRLPVNLPYEVPNTDDNKGTPKISKKKRAKSPPVEIFEPPTAPGPKRNRRLSPKSNPFPRNSSSPPPTEPSQRSIHNASPFARFREPSNSPEVPSERASSVDPSMREARGRLGGVRRGGPENWKPWSKSSEAFSGHPGYLDAD